MNKIKSFFIIALILSLLLSFSVFAIDLPEPTSNFFVNDFADVIDTDDEEELMAIGTSLYKQTTAQVVVVTVDSLDGYEVGEYALELGREWGVGSEETDNGVVLLMSVSDRQVTIQVGYGLEGCLPDGKTGRILDTYAIPYLKNDDFSTGLTEAYKAIVNVVYEEYGLEANPDYVVGNEAYNDNDEESQDGFILYLIFTLVILIVLFSRKGKVRGLIPFILFGKLRGNNHDDDDIFRGGSGGSGSHFGGGGFSGGGGFRGGGGSFGGGGSSRGF